jgi:hypothetical protein
MVLASTERAKELTERPVWIRGIGWAAEIHYLGDRDLPNE